MNAPNLGALVKDGERDAIHIAVEPVTAGMDLLPGQRVGLSESAENTVVVSKNPIGIVDPF